MLFNSTTFVFLFLPVVLLGLYIITRLDAHRFALVWLIIVSGVFYGWFKAIYLPLLAILTALNYLCGSKLSRDCEAGRPRPALLACGVALNLGVLAYFKYMNFFLGNINGLFGSHLSIGEVLLPLGISFFIFQKIAYLADSYKGETSSYTPLEFACFVMYFPQLIAGPIVHHSELIPQLRQRLQISAIDLSAGLCLFTIGLLKKIVLADPLAHFADTLFNVASAGQGQSLIVSWSAALAFSFQIYFDFSGYTDMALGLALMMGIRLPLNFNSPYKARSIIEFWRRWHMTLSRFLRDYVYIPLGGNRQGTRRRFVNLMITMLLGGLWHGAAWTFVAWGGLHGLYLIVNHGWQRSRSLLGFTESTPITRAVAGLTTFLAVVVAWVFFRAQSFDAASVLLKGMVGFYGLGIAPSTLETLNAEIPFWAAGNFKVTVAILAVLVAAVWTLPNSQEILAKYRPAKQSIAVQPLVRASLLVRWGLIGKEGQIALTAVSGFMLAGALFGAMVFQTIGSTTLHPFIYFQF
jgi:D-alanyl-lipoteichoic acid acyltransferase DltB (MBOAT superfamily)